MVLLRCMLVGFCSEVSEDPPFHPTPALMECSFAGKATPLVRPQGPDLGRTGSYSSSTLCCGSGLHGWWFASSGYFLDHGIPGGIMATVISMRSGTSIWSSYGRITAAVFSTASVDALVVHSVRRRLSIADALEVSCPVSHVCNDESCDDCAVSTSGFSVVEVAMRPVSTLRLDTVAPPWQK